MIRTILRKITGSLGSPKFATWLLVIVSAWFVVASFVPQDRESPQEVAAWAAAHPALELAVRALGVHHAFSSPFFLACAALLAIATSICAWRRTKVAVKRMRALRRAALADEAAVSSTKDFEIVCNPAMSESDVVSAASGTFDRLGIKVNRREEVLSAVSPGWSVWGSPVFHWALVALIAVLLAGALTRSEGLMGVAVGQSKPDTPDSYGLLHDGPWRNWGRELRSIRVDAFDTTFTAGGIKRGPTPTVSVLDREGQVIKTQPVYPNSPLRTGSLTIHRTEFGLSATVSLVATNGVEVDRRYELLDFSGKTDDGTVPREPFVLSDLQGNPQLAVVVTVPVDRVPGGFRDRIPEKPMAHVVMSTLDGKKVYDRVVPPGTGIGLPWGDSLRILGIGYYARMNVVNDWTIPLLYVSLAIGMVGLLVTLLVRQQSVLAAVREEEDGLRLAIALRLWRNVPTTRGEIEGALAAALGATAPEGDEAPDGDEKGIRS